MIPFYMTDCNTHERLWMRDFRIENAEAGKVWDVSSSLEDLEILYRRGDEPKMAKRQETPAPASPSPPAAADSDVQRNSPAYQDLLRKLDEMQHAKFIDKGGRNTWQARQRRGQGEPFYRDALMWMEFGRDVFAEKWGRGPCDLRDAGMVEGDAWRVEMDWEKPWVQWKCAKEEEETAKEREKEIREKEEAKAKERSSPAV